MSFYDDMAALAVELLGPGSDFGEQLTIWRPVATYNNSTRQTDNTPPLKQVLWGTADAESLTAASVPESLAAQFERVLLAVPVAGGFEPGSNDRVILGDGRTYQIVKTANIIKAGIPILWQAGLKTA